ERVTRLLCPLHECLPRLCHRRGIVRHVTCVIGDQEPCHASLLESGQSSSGGDVGRSCKVSRPRRRYSIGRRIRLDETRSWQRQNRCHTTTPGRWCGACRQRVEQRTASRRGLTIRTYAG